MMAILNWPSWRDYLHLLAWGQVGVLVRYYLRQVLGGACKHSPSGSSWVPCVTSPGLTRLGGALFLDLPANIVGCFIMGFLSPSDLLLLSRQPPAASPTPPAPSTSQQKTSPVLSANSHTFNSQHSRVSEVEPMSLTGPLQNRILQNPRYATIQLSGNTTNTSVAPPPIPNEVVFTAPVIAPGLAWPALPRDSPLQHHASLLLGLRTGLCGCMTTFASWMLQAVHMLVGSSPALPRGTTEWPEALCAVVIGCLTAQSSLAAGQQLARLSAAFWHKRLKPITPNVHSSISTMDTEQGSGAPTPADQLSLPVGQQLDPNKAIHNPAIIWCCDAIAGLVFVTLTGVSVALIVVTSLADNSADEGSRAAVQASILVWASILMAPVGCLLRWKLSPLNVCSHTSGWPWFPLGTWLANMTACLIDYTTDATLTKLALRDLRADAVAAVVTGVGGSLSTVSTWVVELQKLGMQVPDSNAAVLYLLITLGPALAAGVLVFGTIALVGS